MDHSEKLKYLIELCSESPRGFAVSVGLDRPDVVYNILHGKHGISPVFAKKIVTTYPNINIKWLLGSDQNLFTWGDNPQKNAETGVVNEPKTECKGRKCYIILINRMLPDSLKTILKYL